MFQVEDHARVGAGVALVYEDGPALKKISMALKCQVYNRVEQRMARANKGSQWLSMRSDQFFLESDAFITRQYRFPNSNQTVTVTHGGGNMSNLKATWFTLFCR